VGIRKEKLIADALARAEKSSVIPSGDKKVTKQLQIITFVEEELEFGDPQWG
jgi:hypothetical protein